MRTTLLLASALVLVANPAFPQAAPAAPAAQAAPAAPTYPAGAPPAAAEAPAPAAAPSPASPAHHKGLRHHRYYYGHHGAGSSQKPADAGASTPDANKAYMGGGVILQGAPGAPAPKPQATPPGQVPANSVPP